LGALPPPPPRRKLKKTTIIPSSGDPNGELKTFFKRKKIRLEAGLAFNSSATNVCLKHLDHEPFKYVFDLDVSPCSPALKTGVTFRIFLAPRYDLHGRRFTLEEQRPLLVLMDIFSVKLPPGKSTITRLSTQSTLTSSSKSCPCGWPQNLLLPRGTHSGMHFDLITIISKGELKYENKVKCNNFIYCGLDDSIYPDEYPMGYPFDRRLWMECPRDKILSFLCRKFGLFRRKIYMEDFVGGNIGGGGVVVRHY